MRLQVTMSKFDNDGQLDKQHTFSIKTDDDGVVEWAIPVCFALESLSGPELFELILAAIADHAHDAGYATMTCSWPSVDDVKTAQASLKPQ